MKACRKILFLSAVFSLFTAVFMLCAGCFGTGNNNDDGADSDGSAIHLTYDMETSILSWDCDPSVDHYFVTIETKDGDVVFSDYVGGNVNGKPNTSFLGNETDKIRRAGEEAVVKIEAMNPNGGDPLWVERVPVKCLYVRTLLLDTEKGTLSWEPVPGVDSYLVMSSTKKEVVESCEINVRPYLEEGLLKNVSVSPCGDDSAFCISLKTERQAAIAPIVTGTKYAKGKLDWWIDPIKGYMPYSFDDIQYLVTIKDGEEQVVMREEMQEYAYAPQTSGFSYEITTRLKEDHKDAQNFVSPEPISSTPECLGAVTDVCYEESKKTFAWESESLYQMLWVNGEKVDDITTNEYSSFDIEKEGLTELKIHPISSTDGTYYIPSTHKVRIAPTPEISIVPTGDSTAQITVSNMEGASSFTLKYSGAQGDEYVSVTEEKPVTGGVYSFDWTMPEDTYYTRYTFQATAHFTDGIPTKESTNTGELARSSVPEIANVSFAPTLSSIEFKDTDYDVEVELGGTVYTASYRNDLFYLPQEAIPTDGEESAITVRARAIPVRDYGYPQLNSVWKEFELRFMGEPKGVRIENGVLYWEYEGEYPVLEYETSGGDRVSSTEWEIEGYIAGEWKLSVHALGDNSQSAETDVWYFDSRDSESVSFRKLAPISNVADNVYGLTWTADEYATGSVVLFSDGTYREQFSVDVSQFDFSSYLKQYPNLDVSIHVKGDGSTVLDSEKTYLHVTTDPHLEYQVKNDRDVHSDIIHRASWSNANTSVDDDYELLDPSGVVLDTAKGVLTRQTNFVKSDLVGGYVLRVNAAPGRVGRKKYTTTDIYHLKTGDDKYDWTEKIFYKMYADMTVQDGDLHIATVPEMPQGDSYYMRLRGSEINFAPVYESTTGKWVIPGTYFSDWEVGPNQITVDFEMRMEEADERLLFYNQYVAGRYNFEVKVAPTPEIVFGEYAPRKEYYTYDPTTQQYTENTEKAEDGYIYVGVKEPLDFARSYIYSEYSGADTVENTYTSADESKVAIKKDSLYYFFFSAKVNASAFVVEDGALVYYKDSVESELEMPFIESCKMKAPPVWDNGTLTLSFTGLGNDRLRIYVGGELVTELQPEKTGTNAYRFVYETGLAAGEQITVCWYEAPDALDYSSTEYYCDFTVE